MADEIRPVSNESVAVGKLAAGTALSFMQTGDNGTQIGHVDTVNAYTTMSVVTPAIAPDGTIIRTGSALSHEYYNLFVIGCGGRFEEVAGNFLIMSQRALEYTDKDIRDRLIYLTDADRAEIQTYPSLFMYENADYGKASPDQVAYFGRVTEIRPHGSDHIKVKYHLLKDIPQQTLNELLTELGLGGVKRFNELNRTHWAVKRVDLLDELSSAHIGLL